MTASRSTLGALLIALALLAACAGNKPPPPPEPPDPGLKAEWRLARFALQAGQHSQAVALYEKVLARAYARDDGVTIGDVGYEYALALLRDGTPDLAAEQARKTRLELERRRIPVFAELYLVEAVAYYEDGKPAEARAAAEACLERAEADDPGTRARAHFILGLLAVDSGDSAGVEHALDAMGAPEHAALQADREELQGRWLLMTGRAEAAGSAFDRAALMRQDLRDYTGMAKAIAAGAVAAETSGDTAKAADLYYRAGRSAAAQENNAKAREWLNRALYLAVQNGLSSIEKDSREQLQTLDP